MKSRIITELDKLAKMLPSDYLPLLKDRLASDENVIRNRAAGQLKKILHDYSSFSVSTIDSYFQVLTRTLTRELKIPVKFEIELNESKIRQETASRLLSKAGFDPELTLWLRELLFDKLEQGKGWKIQPELRRMASEVIKRDEARNLAATADRNTVRKLLKELYDIKYRFENTLTGIGEAGMNEIKNAGLSLENFSNGIKGPAGYFAKLQVIKTDKWEPGKLVLKAVEAPETMLRKGDQKNDQLLSVVEEVLHPLLCQAIDEYNDGLYQYTSAEAVLRFLYYTGIIPVIGEELKNIRDEQQVFLLSDTTRLLKENIAGQDAPFVFEKSGIRYRHVFIDEFQDTSQEQWDILLPLAKNTLGNGDQLLLVGDAKQSIYRWRGGNQNLIKRDAARSLKAFEEVLDNRVLNTNWRSGEKIVTFNNAFFPLLANVLNVQYSEYLTDDITESFRPEKIAQEFRSSMKDVGYLDFTFFKAGSKKHVESDPDHESAGWKDQSLHKLKITLDELVAAGYRLKDIAILFRSNSEEEIIASYLLQNSTHRFISSNSLQLENDPSVRFLINCLYILNETDQPVNRVEAEEFLVMRKLQEKREGIPMHKIAILEKNAWFKEVLLSLKKYGNDYPVNLIVAILREKGKLTEANPFVDAFEDKIALFSMKQSGGLNEFLTWWEDQSETSDPFCLEMPESENAIRLLSIHRSKGLEFPVVMIPFCEWKVLPDFRTRLWAKGEEAPFNIVDHVQIAASRSLMNSAFSKDYINECNDSVSDNLNLTYVAFTRPKERLYVFSNASMQTGTISASIIESVRSTGLFEESFNDIQEQYIFGEAKNALKSEEKLVAGDLYSPLSVSASEFQIKAAVKAPLLAADTGSNEINFGNALHDIIAMSVTKDDLHKNIYRASLNYRIPVQDLEPAAIRIMNLLEENGWLSDKWKVYAETDFCDAEGNVFRPDRVLVADGETVILDFKTGAPDELYLDQVGGYCKLLESSGLNNVSGYLVYPVSNLIVPAGSSNPSSASGSEV